MSFLSILYLKFLIIVLCAYFLMYKIFPKLQYLVLLVASYIFYYFISPKGLIFLLFSTITTWAGALLIDFINKKKSNVLSELKDANKTGRIENKFEIFKKVSFLLCILLNIGIFAYIKYFFILVKIFDFLHINSIFIKVFNTNFYLIDINRFVVVAGISFYTFQCLGYLIDVLRETTKAEKNIFKYALFTSFFPQILQGPIHRHKDLVSQLYEPKAFCFDDFVIGFERIVLGLFKKLFVAAHISYCIFAISPYMKDISGIYLLFSTILYGIQLYADFSGYVDIALGTGKMFRLNLKENFNAPYFARSVSDFWRRWHISLSSWFKDYVFYPILYFFASSKIYSILEKYINKNIVKNISIAIALFITWFLIGFWHGCNMRFILYGLYYGFFMIVSVLLAKQFSTFKKICRINEESIIWKGFQIFRTFLIVTFGYVLFEATNLTQAIFIYKSIFTNFINSNTYRELFYSHTYCSWKLTFTGILILLIFEIANYKGNALHWIHKQNKIVRWSIVYSLILLTLVSMINYAGINKFFIYQQF